MVVDVLAVTWPEDRGNCSLEHSVGTAVGGVKVCEDFLLEATRNNRTFMEHDNIPQC